MNIQILEIDSVLYNVGTRSLLTDIYLKCQTGEIVGLLGRNGCGKSTLLKIIFGTLPSFNKHIRINGKVYLQPFRDQQIAYLPQKNFLPATISIRALIDIFIASRKKRMRLKENSRIKQHLAKKVNELSGGERRYIEVLLLLHLDTPFVLLDEPFSGIEPLYKEQIKELLREFRQEKGFILTDHDYKHIVNVSDRIILLTNGACKIIKQLSQLEDYGYIPPGKL